jgi:hypothetical protein
MEIRRILVQEESEVGGGMADVGDREEQDCFGVSYIVPLRHAFRSVAMSFCGRRKQGKKGISDN